MSDVAERAALPAPLEAMLAQVAAVEAQLAALRLSIYAVGLGMNAGAARAAAAAAGRPNSGAVPATFGTHTAAEREQPAVSADDLLARLPNAPAFPSSGE